MSLFSCKTGQFLVFFGRLLELETRPSMIKCVIRIIEMFFIHQMLKSMVLASWGID